MALFFKKLALLGIIISALLPLNHANSQKYIPVPDKGEFLCTNKNETAFVYFDRPHEIRCLVKNKRGSYLNNKEYTAYIIPPNNRDISTSIKCTPLSELLSTITIISIIISIMSIVISFLLRRGLKFSAGSFAFTTVVMSFWIFVSKHL
ncbi:hypothetical protein [Bartonella sp. cb54]|uniref:hypothetical protein n=1 Tax=Bartonella sp. cb54 TaxID=3385560 RepID=UPI0039A6FCEF